MSTFISKKLPKNTYEILITVPKEEVEKAYEKSFEAVRANFETKGFRKGKVPIDVAKKNIPEKTIYDHLIRDLLPKLYEEAVKKENLRPVSSPKVDILKAKRGEDWEIKVQLAEKPIIHLDSYKEIIKKLKEEEKKSEIWVPGKGKEEKSKEIKDQKLLDKILFSLINDIKVEISDLIIEEEMNLRLSRLVDDIQKLGLSVDSYLKSKNLTIDKLKEQFKKEIEDTYKLEFILMEIAEQEKITVDEADMEKIFANIKDPKELEMAKKNAYYYASILRKQKTIEYLLSL